MVSSSAAQLPLLPLLPRRSRIVLRAVAEAMFAEDGEVSSERLDTHVDDVERLLGGTSAPVRFGLVLALFVLRLSPLLLFRHASFLDRLPVHARVGVLDRLERSRLMPLCLAFVGWRTIATLVFYEDPRELAALGYPGDDRARYKRRLPLQIPAAAASGALPVRGLCPRAPTPSGLLRSAQNSPTAFAGARLRDRVLPASLRSPTEGVA